MKLAVVNSNEDKEEVTMEQACRSTTSAQVHEMEVELSQLENTLKVLKLERKIARTAKKVDRRLRRKAFWDEESVFNFFADMGDRINRLGRRKH